MAIWSLTQERVEKLRKQIGEKEDEITTLTSLSAKDIWNTDLDAFVEEWNTQLNEEGQRKKKIASMTRRASHKLGIGAAGKGKGKKKRKADDSDSDDDSGSDFGPVKKKAKPKKEGGLLSYLREDAAPAKKPSAAEAMKASSAFGTQKQGSMLTHLVKKEKQSTPQLDGSADDIRASAEPAPAPATKRGKPAAAKNVKKPEPTSVTISDDESDVFAAVAEEVAREPVKAPSRAARGAAKAVPKYRLGGSDSDSEDDELLDVSTMVKGMGTSSGAPMFKSTARPGSGSGRPTSAVPASRAAKKFSPIDMDDDSINVDTTNYEGLMPQASPERPAPRNVNDTIMGSDDEDFGYVAKKPAPAPKLTAKAKAPATKPAPKAKAASVVAKKATALSPAAKAYAAKLAKVQSSKPAPKTKKPVAIDSDDEMEEADAIANDILSDDDDDEPTPKPAKRAPAARPGRRAAAAPAKYVVSDDDDEESDAASEPSFEEDDSE